MPLGVEEAAAAPAIALRQKRERGKIRRPFIAVQE